VENFRPAAEEAAVRDEEAAQFRRLAQTNAKALEKLRGYVERGEGEIANESSLAALVPGAAIFCCQNGSESKSLNNENPKVEL